MKKWIAVFAVVAIAACSKGSGPSGPSPIDVPEPVTVAPSAPDTVVTAPQAEPEGEPKIATISANGTVTISEERNWTACVFDARVLSHQPLLYQYPVSGPGSTPFQEPEECGNYTIQLDVQAGAVCPAFAELGFDGFRAGRIIGAVIVDECDPPPCTVDCEPPPCTEDCEPVCEDEEPVITYGEWSEWEDVLTASTTEPDICTEEYSVTQTRTREVWSQTCDEEPIQLENEYDERQDERERVIPCPKECPLPSVDVLTWKGKGDPETECAAFGSYVPTEGVPTFYICKAGKDREVWLEYPDGDTCRNDKDISHVTACVCSE